MQTFFDAKNSARMGKILMLLALFATLFLAMKFVNETKAVDAWDSDLTKYPTIDVVGEGTAFAIPDIASISFTVEKKGATVHDAQVVVTEKANAAIEYLKKAGIAEKDIQTTNYNAYPEYDYSNQCSGKSCASEPKLTGYHVSETITVKVRSTANAGSIVDGLGKLGVTGLSGPQFTLDNADVINAQARTKAIADAKEKAEILSRQLGVTLVRIVRFSESGGGSYPVPMYAKDMAVSAGRGGEVAPNLPTGENKYTSTVTITYAIQ